MTTFTNIHVAESNLRESARSAEITLPRLRPVTNDPAREYAQRPGEVERLPDSIAQMILSKKGFSQVTRNGIRVEGITPKPLVFWSEHSVTIAEKAGTNDKVLWVLNRLNPDVIHILKPSGEYVETIPLDEKAEWFNPADMQRVLGAKRRSQNRTIERVASLHAPDTEAAVGAAAANEIALKSIVHTFPQPISPRDRRDSTGATVLPAASGQERIADATRAGSLSEGQRSNLGASSAVAHRDAGTVELPSRAEGLARSSARAAFPKADRIHQVQRHLDGQRTGHAERVQTLARRVADVTDQDLDDLTSDDGLELVAARTATEIAPEEDASDCIL